MNKASQTKRIMMEDLNDDGVLNLLEGFVELIREDFIRLYNQVRDNPRNKQAIQNYNYIRGLILSEYFAHLTGLNGEEVLPQLEYECSKKYRRMV